VGGGGYREMDSEVEGVGNNKKTSFYSRKKSKKVLAFELGKKTTEI